MIEEHQKANYDKGLAELVRVIDPGIHESALAEARTASDEGVAYENMTVDAKLMVDFNALQRALSKDRSILLSRKSTADVTFKCLYVLGTLLLIAGGVAKIVSARSEVPKEQLSA